MGTTSKKIIFQIIKWSIICAVLVMIYMTFIEPKLLRARYVEVYSPYVTTDLEGYKIVQFTDTQLGTYYTLNDLERAVKRINQVDADLVVFTGDLIDHMRSYTGDVEGLGQLLAQIKSRDGKYAIYGNHDQGGGAHRTYPAIMKAGNFTLLKNTVETIKVGQSVLNIAGIDDWLLGYPELETTLKQLPKNQFNLVLLHEPDVAELVAPFPVDLQLSGHTHGGQVRIPFVGTPITPPIGHLYIKGLHNISERLQLHVSSGLGSTMIPLRFMNIPEITVITLKHASE